MTDFADLNEMLDSLREYMRGSNAIIIPCDEPTKLRLGYVSTADDGRFWRIKFTNVKSGADRSRIDLMATLEGRWLLLDILRLEVADEKLQGSHEPGQYTDVHMMMAAIRNHLLKNPQCEVHPLDNPMKGEYGYVSWDVNDNPVRWFIKMEDLRETGFGSVFGFTTEMGRRIKAIMALKAPRISREAFGD